MKLTEAVYAADEIIDSYLLKTMRAGYTYSHRVQKPFDPTIRFGDLDALRDSITDTIHASIIYQWAWALFEHSRPPLVYFDSHWNLRYLGRYSDWDVRIILWTYCEPCKKLFYVSRVEKAIDEDHH